MSAYLKLAEKIFVVLSLLVFSDAFLPFLNEGRDLGKQVLLYGIAVITAVLIMARWKRFKALVIKEKIFWLLLGIALVSVFWSDSPTLTLSRSINLVQVTLFAVYFATRYSLKEQLQLLAWTLGIAGLSSAAVALALPRRGLMGLEETAAEAYAHAGAWRGVFGHKNVLGRAMVLSALVFLFLANSSRKYRWVAWIGFGFSVGLIVLSTSKTALVILPIVMALLPLYRALRWKNTLAVFVLITLILVGGGVALFLVSNPEWFLGVLGRDVTLTGRTVLWAAVFYKIWERPWLGYGYDGFWQGWDGESAFVWSLVRWEVPNAHNGFFDLWLDLGLLGLSTFTLLFVKTCFRAATWIRLTNSVEGFIPLTYLTFILLSNLTESSLMRQDIFWILYAAFTFSMHNKNINFVKHNKVCQQKVKEETMKQKITMAKDKRM